MDYDNICEICFKDYDNNSIVLNCNHKFHINCIKYSIENKKKTVCPYCRGKINNDIIHNILRCNAILKSGKNKGNRCCNNSKFDIYCGIHKNNMLKNK